MYKTMWTISTGADFWTNNSILRGVSCWDATLKYDMTALFRFNPELLWVLQCRFFFFLKKQQLSHLTIFGLFFCLFTYLRPPHIKVFFGPNLSRNGKFSIAAIQRRWTATWRFVGCALWSKPWLVRLCRGLNYSFVHKPLQGSPLTNQ